MTAMRMRALLIIRFRQRRESPVTVNHAARSYTLGMIRRIHALATVGVISRW